MSSALQSQSPACGSFGQQVRDVLGLDEHSMQVTMVPTSNLGPSRSRLSRASQAKADSRCVATQGPASFCELCANQKMVIPLRSLIGRSAVDIPAAERIDWNLHNGYHLVEQ